MKDLEMANKYVPECVMVGFLRLFNSPPLIDAGFYLEGIIQQRCYSSKSGGLEGGWSKGAPDCAWATVRHDDNLARSEIVHWSIYLGNRIHTSHSSKDGSYLMWEISDLLEGRIESKKIHNLELCLPKVIEIHRFRNG
jgi:hypothetical protein